MVCNEIISFCPPADEEASPRTEQPHVQQPSERLLQRRASRQRVLTQDTGGDGEEERHPQRNSHKRPPLGHGLLPPPRGSLRDIREDVFAAP